MNYVYVPSPNVHPTQLPQFDYELPSLRLLPIEFPEYNSIDSIDSQNVLRFGLRNQLQTKREGRVEDFLDWQLYTDWRLNPRPDQATFADLYSDVSLAPRSWIAGFANAIGFEHRRLAVAAAHLDAAAERCMELDVRPFLFAG